MVYEKQDLLLETNKKDFGRKIHIHETNLLCMHDIKKIKNKNFTLTFNPFFEFQNLQFYNKENFKKKKNQICI